MSRIGTVVEGIKTIVSACVPVLRPYKVSYMRKKEVSPGVFQSKWTVMAQTGYNREDAADKVQKAFGLAKKLRPGRNCYSTRIMERDKAYNEAWVQEAIETGKPVERPEAVDDDSV